MEENFRNSRRGSNKLNNETQNEKWAKIPISIPLSIQEAVSILAKFSGLPDLSIMNKLKTSEAINGTEIIFTKNLFANPPHIMISFMVSGRKPPVYTQYTYDGTNFNLVH